MFRGKAQRRRSLERAEYSDDEGYYEEDDMEGGRHATQRGMAEASVAAQAAEQDRINFSRGSLDELGINWSRLRRIDLRWKEKLLAVVDTLQVYALMWSLSQPWPWPRPWLTATRWTVVANLDVVSIHDAAMTVTGPGTYSSPWGERKGYVFYAFLFTVVPVGIQTLWYFRKVLAVLWLDRRMLFHRIVLGESRPSPPGAKVVSTLVAFERALLLSAHLLYLPVLLAVIRLLLCDGDGTLSVDPTISCRSVSLVLPAMLGCGVIIAFTLDLKRHTTDAGHAVTTYSGKSDHERFLQRVEIEYSLNLCNGWEVDHLWMVCSFRRHAVRYRVYMMYLKLVLVLVYAFGRSNLESQAVMFWGLITFWSVWSCTHPPYRCRSSNRLHYVLHATLWLDALLGMMTGYGVRGSLLVASRLFRLMTATNLVAAAIAVGVVIAPPIEEELARRRHKKRVLQAARRNRAALASGNDDSSSGDSAAAVGSGAMSATNGLHDTPAVEAGANDAHSTAPGPLVYPDRWPTRATLIALASNPRRREWVDAIRRAKEFRFQCEMCPRGLEPVRALEAFMRHVRAIWAEAKAEDSALEPALGATLERLALVHARMAYRVKQEGGGLTEALEEALLDPTVVAGMQRRRRAQALMTDRQKRVMIKLFAVSAFLNHRDLRDSSAASVLRLRDETERIFSQPLTADSRASLKTICMQWKRLIQKSEREFEEAHGHPPLLSDKEENSEWYGFYKKLRAALETLPAPGPSDGGGLAASTHESVSARRDDDASLSQTPEVSASLVTLTRATKQLLATGGPSPGGGSGDGGGFDVNAADACRKQWKRAIRVWEGDFERRTGNPPGVSDKQLIRDHYDYYQRLRDLVGRTGL
ncbi:unnamed protein product [Ectocarpus sp. 12 AP-2014]